MSSRKLGARAGKRRSARLEYALSRYRPSDAQSMHKHLVRLRSIIDKAIAGAMSNDEMLLVALNLQHIRSRLGHNLMPSVTLATVKKLNDLSKEGRTTAMTHTIVEELIQVLAAVDDRCVGKSGDAPTNTPESSGDESEALNAHLTDVCVV